MIDCSNCEALCCYDGVYVSKKEKHKIIAFVTTYPEYFKDILDKELFTIGDWPGLEGQIKTNTVSYKYKNKPKHFNNTRCIFVDEDHKCRLQKVCIDLGLDEWSIKPSSCCIFPIEIIKGEIKQPPQSSQEDVYNFGPDYPGYVSSLECSRLKENEDWKDKFKKEINYLKHNGGKK